MFPVPGSRYLIGHIPWYSALIVLGACIAVWMAVREEKRLNLKKDTIIDLTLWLLPFGIVGARIYYVFFSWDQFASDPLSVFYIWEGGIAIYGAVIAGLIVILVFCRIRHQSVLTLCDLIAPGLALAQSIGRWGNYFNMEAYGPEITNPSLCFFPFAVLIRHDTGFTWHMAAFFYESLADALIFLFLIVARRKWLRKTGDVFFFYAFLYGSARLVIEELRTDSLYSSSLRISQVLAFLICLSVLIYYFIKRKKAVSWSRRIVSVICFVSSVLFSVFVFSAITHTGPVFLPSSLKIRLIFLSSFSLLMILSLFVIYGPSDSTEVLYANHTDQKPAVSPSTSDGSGAG